MKVHQGKAGGPDVSDASETAQLFQDNPTALMKVTCEGKANEQKLVKISDVHKGNSFITLRQSQNSNAHWGFANAGGTLLPAGTGSQTGQQVSCYKDHAKPCNYDATGYVLLTIGADGKPTTYLLGLSEKP